MTQPKKIKRPRLGLWLTEPFRAIGERIGSKRYRSTYQPNPKGDSHPVLVIPGFMTNDASCKPLRKFVKRLGYVPYPWGLGRNLANLEDLEILQTTMDAIYKEHGTKMTIIGWSLGGVYARELAKVKPELVRQVITLGSPFAGIQEPNNAAWIFDLIKGKDAQKALDPQFIATLPNPAPVPTTAIYSKKDGIVPWEVCRERKEDATHQNIEVTTSHLGMGFSKVIMQLLIKLLPRYANSGQAKAHLNGSTTSSKIRAGNN